MYGKKAGKKSTKKCKTKGKKMRGVGAAKKGTKYRGPMG